MSIRLLLDCVCISFSRLSIVCWSTWFCFNIFVCSSVTLHSSKLMTIALAMFWHSLVLIVTIVAKRHCSSPTKRRHSSCRFRLTTRRTVLRTCTEQRRRYTRPRQVKWPGWKIHCPGSSPGSALLSHAYCFASVIVWTENKNVTISDRFICFILTVKRRWRPVFWRRQLKKVVNFFEEISASWWPGWGIFWPRNDLVPLLHWRRHW